MDSRPGNITVLNKVAEILEAIQKIDEVTEDTIERVTAIVSEVNTQISLGKTLDGIHFVQVTDKAYVSISILVNGKAIYGVINKDELNIMRSKYDNSDSDKQHATNVDSPGHLNLDSSTSEREKAKSPRRKKRSSKSNSRSSVSRIT